MQSHHPIGTGLAAAAILCAAACNHGAQAGGFTNGDFVTYSQVQWDTSASGFFFANYATVYGPSFMVEVGVPGSAPDQLSIRFTNSIAVVTYFQSIGPDPLVADATNPAESEVAGSFGGNTLALQLNVDFSDAGVMPATAGIPFGDLVLTGLDTQPLLNGLTVRQFLANANARLGDGSGIFTSDPFGGVTHQLTSAFTGGTVSEFAQDHLRIACPADLNGDLAGDVNDLLLMIGAWGATGANAADINGDNVVDVNDLLILIGGWGPCSGVPANDGCSTPTSIGTGNTAVIQWNNYLASHDGLPTPRTCNIFGDTDITRDLWFLWTAGPDADGEVRVETCTSPGFDNKMAMYNYPTACPPTADPIACADDNICAFSRAAFHVAIVPGQQYLIRVGSYNDFGPSGLGTLQILQNNP